VTGTGMTDGSGQATFTFTGAAADADDVIDATFVDAVPTAGGKSTAAILNTGTIVQSTQFKFAPGSLEFSVVGNVLTLFVAPAAGTAPTNVVSYSDPTPISGPGLGGILLSTGAKVTTYEVSMPQTLVPQTGTPIVQNGLPTAVPLTTGGAGPLDPTQRQCGVDRHVFRAESIRSLAGPAARLPGPSSRI